MNYAILSKQNSSEHLLDVTMKVSSDFRKPAENYWDALLDLVPFMQL